MRHFWKFLLAFGAIVATTILFPQPGEAFGRRVVTKTNTYSASQAFSRRARFAAEGPFASSCAASSAAVSSNYSGGQQYQYQQGDGNDIGPVSSAPGSVGTVYGNVEYLPPVTIPLPQAGGTVKAPGTGNSNDVLLKAVPNGSNIIVQPPGTVLPQGVKAPVQEIGPSAFVSSGGAVVAETTTVRERTPRVSSKTKHVER